MHYVLIHRVWRGHLKGRYCRPCGHKMHLALDTPLEGILPLPYFCNNKMIRMGSYLCESRKCRKSAFDSFKKYIFTNYIILIEQDIRSQWFSQNSIISWIVIGNL